MFILNGFVYGGTPEESIILRGPVFEPLSDETVFTKCSVDLTLFLSQINIKAGLSEPFRGFKRMALFSGQAVHALEAGESIDSGNHLFPYEAYVLPHLYRRIVELPESFSFIHESIPFLERYDQEHKADYLQTLRQFLKNECSLVGTANALYIHRNTLVYRIRQIRELTGLDLDQWAVRFRILLSIEVFLTKKGSV